MARMRSLRGFYSTSARLSSWNLASVAGEFPEASSGFEEEFAWGPLVMRLVKEFKGLFCERGRRTDFSIIAGKLLEAGECGVPEFVEELAGLRKAFDAD